MKTTKYIFFTTMFFLTISCETKIPETDLKCSELKEEDGLIYQGDKRFTGSCYTLYDFNLEKDEIRSYKRGLRDGVWVKYYGNGYLQYVGNAKKGEIHGKYIGYYNNGVIKEEGNMKEGYRDGNWSLNNENGDLIRVEIHKNKTLIDIREF
jgi:antitoxin component YwqK of YwqJK toxin-antitoxin module